MTKEISTAQVGKFGERTCIRYLKKNGYKILDTNCRMGRLEMDIISANKTHLVFTEVKTRRSDLNNTSRPASAVNKDKKSYLISFARSYVKSVSQKQADKQIRIDVCEVLVYQKGKKLKVNDINYIENAITR